MDELQELKKQLRDFQLTIRAQDSELNRLAAEVEDLTKQVEHWKAVAENAQVL